MLEDTIVPTVTVRSFPHQKPWVDGSVRAALNARAPLPTTPVSYRQHGRIQSGAEAEAPQLRVPTHPPVDDLNSFYVRLEASNNTASGTVAEVSSIARDEHTLSVTEHDVRRALMRVNTRHISLWYLKIGIELFWSIHIYETNRTNFVIAELPA